jgi:hypothetical protein
MADAREPRDAHDRLVKHVFTRKDAFAVELRRVLPPKLLAHLDWASLERRSTERTDERLRGRISDLCFSIDYVDGEQRWPLLLPLEHHSTFAGHLPLRVVVCAGEIWYEHLRDNPKVTTFPVIVPILLAQHPARNTPTQLSSILDYPPSLRELLPIPIEATIYVDDLSGSVLDDPYAEPATLALVELARAFLRAYKNPASLTEARLAELAPLFDVLLEQDEPLASSDVNALWTYVLHAFEDGSPVRAMIEKVIQGRPREMYTTIAESLIAEGRAAGLSEGRAAGLSEALLRTLEHRHACVPEPVRARVLATRDAHQLQRWLDRAFTAASAEEIFDALDG